MHILYSREIPREGGAGKGCSEMEKKPYISLSKQELEQEKQKLTAAYDAFKSKGLKLDMSRGKPAGDQFDLAAGLLDALNSQSSPYAEDGADCRNYGVFDGIPECKAIFAGILDVEPSEVFVGGNSSLALMYDAIAKMMLLGVHPGATPWCKLDKVKFLCPVPGYDRHFAITESFGIEMVNVPLLSTGPDMELVEELVANDASIKGIWCIPKYSNPTGITYSDETVRRFAKMKTAAEDFVIMWDNAYAVHDLYPESGDRLLGLLEECKKAGNPNRAMLFTSTSKISYAGAGIAAFACAEQMMKRMKALITIQTIGYDKMNMLRHVRYFQNLDGVMQHMKKEAALLQPKFQIVLDTFAEELDGLEIAQWYSPNGGYFISVDVLDGCAKRAVQLCKEAGAVLTGAGATFPYGKDPRDCNIRVAPTYPGVEELKITATLLCVAVKLAACEKLLGTI